MSLQSNLQSEGDKFKEYYGQNRVQMPLLLAERRVPLSVAGIMKRKLEVRSSEFGREYKGTSKQASIAHVRDAWWANYSDSGDGALYHPDDRIKVVLDADYLRKLQENSPLIEGGLDIAWYVRNFILNNPKGISEEDLVQETLKWYNALDASEFTREQVQKDRFGTVWLALAREDNALLGEYRQAVADELKTRHNYTGENMGVYLRDAPNAVVGRLWCVRRGYDGSSVYGDNNLDNYSGRLFGVAPEAQSPVAQVKEKVSEVSLVAPSIVRPSKEEVFAVLEDRINNWDPRTTPLNLDYFRSAIEGLYNPKQ